MKLWKQENPLQTLEHKHGFFVPALDLERVQQLVARAAVPYRFSLVMTPGIYKGLIGVWCYRKERGQLAQFESSFAARNPTGDASLPGKS